MDGGRIPGTLFTYSEKENNSLSLKWELTQMKEKAILIWRDGKEGSVRLFLRA